VTSGLRRWLWLAGGPARAAAIGVIRVYQVSLGGLAGARCRFYPSCSHYAVEAIRRCGVVGGLGLAAWRILRCSPLSKGGVDYPPAGRGGGAALYDNVIHPKDGDSPEGAPA
jgi:putative membrane protein insertion efficiency factor